MAEFTLQEIIDATSGTCKGDVSLQFKRYIYRYAYD